MRSSRITEDCRPFSTHCGSLVFQFCRNASHNSKWHSITVRFYCLLLKRMSSKNLCREDYVNVSSVQQQTKGTTRKVFAKEELIKFRDLEICRCRPHDLQDMTVTAENLFHQKRRWGQNNGGRGGGGGNQRAIGRESPKGEKVGHGGRGDRGGRGGRGKKNGGHSEDLVDGLAPILNKSESPAYVPLVGRYVAPGARKGGMSLGERMRKERETVTMGATTVIPKGIAGAFAGKKLPVGMAPADQGKSKNVLRKERHPTLSLGQRLLAKEKQEQVEEEERQRNEQEEKLRLDVFANDPVKMEKKLNKILKQILELKKKDPACLNEAQMKKVAREAVVLQKLAELRYYDYY